MADLPNLRQSHQAHPLLEYCPPMLNRREFAHGLAGTAALLAAKQSALAAPTAQETAKPLLQLQQEFMDLRFGMFLHLNMATFEQREWGDPKASPKLFNPAHLDTDQWAQAARSAGMAYGCLTTKHHDGFCLWPTKTTSPSVKDATFTQDVVASYASSFESMASRSAFTSPSSTFARRYGRTRSL